MCCLFAPPAGTGKDGDKKKKAKGKGTVAVNVVLPTKLATLKVVREIMSSLLSETRHSVLGSGQEKRK